jgi:hypothetical protein
MASATADDAYDRQWRMEIRLPWSREPPNRQINGRAAQE